MMRKTGLVVLIYAFIAFALCLLISNFTKQLPILIAGDERTYIITRGFLIFCKFFPALVMSGFLLGAAVSYGKDAEKAKIKYSPLIMAHFRRTVILSLVVVLIISMVTEVFVPVFKQRQARAEMKPVLYGEFMRLANENFNKGKMKPALEYSYNALLLNPTDKDAARVKDQAEAEINSVKMVLDRPEEPKFVFIPVRETKGETITSLLEKAKKAAESQKWFDVHYYAFLALEVGSKKDINLDEANRLASEAWNHLFAPVAEKETEEQKLFKRKREAYKTLIRGDNIEAYYQFLSISSYSDVAARDPDVSKFLEVARNRVEEQCFFTDESENLGRFETYNNIYFAISHDDGTRDVVFINGITPIKNSGRMVQYLRNFTMFTYSKEGSFLRSIHVPYAKMLSQKTEVFDEQTKERFGIKDSFESVPFLMLESISKNERAGRVSPEFEYDVAYTNKNEPRWESNLVLAMPMKDFNLLCDATAGSAKMSLISLMKFMTKARDYGYSYEVYNADFLYRITYPLIMLICCIFMACMAWNYRLKNEQLFKFKWIFLMPAITLILFFVIECGLYICRMLNYALVIMLGNAAVYVSVALLVMIFVIVCFDFVSRTAD